MKPWQPAGYKCVWQADRQDALRVAAILNIPLLTWDFSREYGQRVAKYMLDGYRRGITPNPDIICNKEIKFGLFFCRAIRQGADFVATGHYARLMKRMTRGVRRETQHYVLRAARDMNKDQTYFLWAIKPQRLERTLFPVGDLLKSQVRELARKASLTTAAKKDSQGVCFIGELDVKSFLARSIRSRAGKILHTDGRILGTHDGAEYYTIGQRHGLDIKDGSGPYFVIRKDVRQNIIIVGLEKELYGWTAKLIKTNWFEPRPAVGTRVQVKIRYRTPSHSAIIERNGMLTFACPVKAITPGQSAVIYQGSRLIGGGIIR